MKPSALRLLGLAVGTILLSAAYSRISSVSLMTDTARNFLDSLTAAQRAKVTFEFQNEERFNWHFIPRPRKGLPLREMTPAQKHLARALLSAGLSQTGYIKATTVMSLEEILRVLEHDSGERRNPEAYFFSIFGRPSGAGTWGYRIEGHHLSLNFTIVQGRVTGSPNFLGANPAEVKQGPRKGLRTLAREEDLARELLAALSAEQRAVAIVNKTAYRDILTGASRKEALEGQPSGLSAAKMTAKQRDLLRTLTQEYAENLTPQLAQARAEQISKAGANLFFAWAGGIQRGQRHYYRVQAPTFLIEYDNTQNNANHIHSVWRDFDGDFGLDLLKRHYQASHR
jgi:hypothetical protein